MAVLDVRQDGRATVRAIDCLSEVSCNDRSLQSLPGDTVFQGRPLTNRSRRNAQPIRALSPIMTQRRHVECDVIWIWLTGTEFTVSHAD